MDGGAGTVAVVASTGCSRFFVGRSFCSASATSKEGPFPVMGAAGPPPAPQECAAAASQPFAGLVICVTGLSREARDQVMAATERLGGQYSASLHPKCTHLVVQSFSGRKFEHAQKHGPKNGLLIVTVSWFVDSVNSNARLNESLYAVKSMVNGHPLREVNHLIGQHGSENSCLPSQTFDNNSARSKKQQHQSFRREVRGIASISADDTIYIDPDISYETKMKIIDEAIKEGAKILDHWFVGSDVTFVVCEGPSVQRYIGHSSYIVTPLWISKTIKEKNSQRLVHLSVDLARQVASVLETIQLHQKDQNDGTTSPTALYSKGASKMSKGVTGSLEQRQKLVDLAKQGVRDRRNRRMQSCLVPMRPITPPSLLESICWSVSEPISSACVYVESSGSEDAGEQQQTTYFDAKGDGKELELSTQNSMRPLNESEKLEVILKNHFLTILFPVDRFGELGPSSRTFFSNAGFTCIQMLDLIYSFYQESMAADEIEVALHTDSRHADRLRSLYAKAGTAEETDRCSIECKRIDFLGSRRSFEALKRVNLENSGIVYELLIRA